MKFLRVAFCFLCFTLDVHVRAEESHHAAKAEAHDDSCAAPCVINATKKYVLKSPNVILAKGALAELRSSENLHLVRGNFLVQSPGSFTTPFAKFSCEGECTAVVERQAGKVTLRNIKGDWQVDRMGDKQTYAVPPAMLVVVTEVDSSGQAGLDFPQALPWMPTVKLWGSLYVGDVHGFKEALEEFRPVWEEAVDAVSDLNSRTAIREIASADQALAKQQALKRAREKEDADLRKLFREKNSVSP